MNLRLTVRCLVLSGMLAASGRATALSFAVTAAAPDQADFHSVARDITAALDYKALEPAAASSLIAGADAFASYAPTRDGGAWQRLTGRDVHELVSGGLAAHGELPLGVDVGAFVGGIGASQARFFGGEVRYAILKGSVFVPAVAVRASFTGTSGMQDLSYRSYSTDVSVSKGFPFVAPYAGVGYVYATVKADGRTGLGEETPRPLKGFAGARFSIGPLESALEYTRIGSNSVYNLRFGVSI